MALGFSALRATGYRDALFEYSSGIASQQPHGPPKVPAGMPEESMIASWFTIGEEYARMKKDGRY
jgi:hypothetical protein